MAETKNQLREFQRIIIGIDPGTNVMGYGILGINGKELTVIALGVVKLNKFESHYKRLNRIFERTLGLVEQYLPDEMAIEAPFVGKNIQSVLKLGRAQGVAMAAALHRDIPITEYAPLKIKMAITGNGRASKEQVAEMLRRILNIPREHLPEFLDATDALAAALCHFYETTKPAYNKGQGDKHPQSHSHTSTSKAWKDFVNHNPDRVKS